VEALVEAHAEERHGADREDEEGREEDGVHRARDELLGIDEAPLAEPEANEALGALFRVVCAVDAAQREQRRDAADHGKREDGGRGEEHQRGQDRAHDPGR
jgi:hypothetical protein